MVNADTDFLMRYNLICTINGAFVLFFFNFCCHLFPHSSSYVKSSQNITSEYEHFPRFPSSRACYIEDLFDTMNWTGQMACYVRVCLKIYSLNQRSFNRIEYIE